MVLLVPLVISIHALLAESDRCPTQCPAGPAYFYPRSPCGERQLYNRAKGLPIKFLSTLSLRRATKNVTQTLAKSKFLSTLSLRRATGTPSASHRSMQFLSTLSLRRATDHPPGLCMPHLISIHALLAESDTCPLKSALVRSISIHALLAESDFYYFTLPVSRCLISIHALLAESDNMKMRMIRASKNFYPRSPCGERPLLCYMIHPL